CALPIWKSFCRLSHAKIWDRLSILQQDKDKNKNKDKEKEAEMPEVLQAKKPLCDVLVNYRHLNNRKIVRNFSWQYLGVKISDKRMFDYMTVGNLLFAFLMPKFGTGCPSYN